MKSLKTRIKAHLEATAPVQRLDFLVESLEWYTANPDHLDSAESLVLLPKIIKAITTKQALAVTDTSLSKNSKKPDCITNADGLAYHNETKQTGFTIRGLALAAGINPKSAKEQLDKIEGVTKTAIQDATMHTTQGLRTVTFIPSTTAIKVLRVFDRKGNDTAAAVLDVLAAKGADDYIKAALGIKPEAPSTNLIDEQTRDMRLKAAGQRRTVNDLVQSMFAHIQDEQTRHKLEQGQYCAVANKCKKILQVATTKVSELDCGQAARLFVILDEADRRMKTGQSMKDSFNAIGAFFGIDMRTQKEVKEAQKLLGL